MEQIGHIWEAKLLLFLRGEKICCLWPAERMGALLYQVIVQLKGLRIPLLQARLSEWQWTKTAKLVRRVAATHRHLSANILQTAAANSKLVDGWGSEQGFSQHSTFGVCCNWGLVGVQQIQEVQFAPPCARNGMSQILKASISALLLPPHCSD